jgi:hypothetical protein
VAAPLFLLGVLLGSEKLGSEKIEEAGIVFGLVCWSFAILTQRSGYATPTEIFHRRGVFGFSTETVPIQSVDEIFLDPMGFPPDAGTVTITHGPRYMTFECVRDAEVVRDRILAWRDRASASDTPSL